MLFKRCAAMTIGWLSLLGVQASCLAATLDIGLSNDVAQVTYAMEYRQNLTGHVSLLHADLTRQQSNVASLGFFTSQNAGDLTPRLGAKLFLVDGEGAGNSAYGVALSVGSDFVLKPKWVLAVDVSYAPKVITGGDFEEYYELSARCAYQLINNGSLYLGYQKNQAVSPNYQVYQGGVAGIRLKF